MKDISQYIQNQQREFDRIKYELTGATLLLQCIS